MKLFIQEKNQLNLIRSKPFNLEKEIQDLVEQNVEELFDLEFVKSEMSIGGFHFDTLCYDIENNSFVIIEYKKGSSYSVIDQGYTYLSILLNNKSDFILEYNETKNNLLKRDGIDWSQSRIIFISPKFSEYQKTSINFKNVPFELWEIKRFENGLIGFDKHLTNSEESIDTFTTEIEDTVVKKVSQEVKVHKESDHLGQSRVSQEIKELYQELKKRIIDLGDDIDVVPRSMYIGFKRDTNFIDIKLTTKSLWCWINMKKGELDDPNELCRDVSQIGHYGNGDYDLRVKSDTDLDYLMFLIKQSYKKQEDS